MKILKIFGISLMILCMSSCSKEKVDEKIPTISEATEHTAGVNEANLGKEVETQLIEDFLDELYTASQEDTDALDNYIASVTAHTPEKTEETSIVDVSELPGAIEYKEYLHRVYSSYLNSDCIEMMMINGQLDWAPKYFNQKERSVQIVSKELEFRESMGEYFYKVALESEEDGTVTVFDARGRVRLDSGLIAAATMEMKAPVSTSVDK